MMWEKGREREDSMSRRWIPASWERERREQGFGLEETETAVMKMMTSWRVMWDVVVREGEGRGRIRQKKEGGHGHWT